MAITITTINNEAAAAKTFTEISKDRVSAEWINSTDSTATLDIRLKINQSLIGKNKQTGIPVRRTLVQCKTAKPANLFADPPTPLEEVTVNLTVTTPVAMSLLSTTQRKDTLAFIRNFVTAAVLDQLCNGEV